MMKCSQQWNIPPRDLQLREHEVHVWRASTTRSDAVTQHLKYLLSEEEGIRAARFFFARDRKSWIVARALLRILLGRYANTDPTELRISFTDYGKPFLAFPWLNPPLQFNLSHSGDLALYAFASTSRVGVDVEYKRSGLDYEALAKVSFSPHEQMLLSALPDDIKREAFFNCWTRKEAYIKARGMGLSLPPDQFDVSLIPGEPAVLLQSREDPREIGHWVIQELAPGTGYAGALAVEGTGWRLSCWQYQE